MQSLVLLLEVLQFLVVLLESLTILAKINHPVRNIGVKHSIKICSAPIVPMMSVRNPNLSDEPSERSNDNKDVNIWGQNNPMYKGEIKTD